MAAVLAAAIVALVLVSYTATIRQLTSASDDLLAREAEAYAAAVAGAPSTDPLSDATRAYLGGRTSGGAGFAPVLFLRLDSGRVISNSDLRLEDSVALTAGERGPEYLDISLGDATYRVLVVPVEAQEARVGTFVAALSEAPARETASRVALTLAGAGAVALALGVALSYAATRRALRPLRDMSTDATDITHAVPGRRISYEGPDDELGALAAALNAMLDRLERAYGEQKRFVADASHELRTPVAVIRGNVDLLRAGSLGSKEATESLAMIEGETRRMARLLDDLLALARLEGARTERFQPLDARTLIDEVTARSRSLADRRFETTHGCDVWITGDPDLLDQALVNVVRNAIAHTAEGGLIRIGCEVVGHVAEISVTDDGPGLSAEELDRAFDRFYRAPGSERDDEGGGAGLGLAITRRLIELHGGTISATNAEEGGARFTIRLPSVDDPDAAPDIAVR